MIISHKNHFSWWYSRQQNIRAMNNTTIKENDESDGAREKGEGKMNE